LNSVDKDFSRLVEIMATLRSENGCPWDRAQNHKSLRQHLLEEAYEVIETIDEEHYEKLPDELGDLLLQVIFHAQMASEELMNLEIYCCKLFFMLKWLRKKGYST